MGDDCGTDGYNHHSNTRVYPQVTSTAPIHFSRIEAEEGSGRPNLKETSKEMETIDVDRSSPVQRVLGVAATGTTQRTSE